MKDDEIRRLMSEYAAGSISDADRRILYQEALENQSVFESLAAEQPLADLMKDAAARFELRQELASQEHGGWLSWLLRPWPIAVAAAAGVALMAILVTRNVDKPALISETRGPSDNRTVAPVPQLQPPLADSLDAPTASGKRSALPVQRAIPPAVKAKRAEPPSESPLPAAPAPAAEIAENRPDSIVPQRSNEVVRAQMAPAATPAAAPPAAIPAATADGAVGQIAGGVSGGMGRSGEPKKEMADKAARAMVSQGFATIEQARSRASAGPAIRYQILRRGQGGDLEPVPPETPFKAGDSVRVRLEPETSGYLAVAEQGSDNTWRILFPAAGDRAVRVAGLAPLFIPPGGPWELGPSASDRRLLVIFTTEPQAALLTSGVIRRPALGTVLEIVIHTAR